MIVYNPDIEKFVDGVNFGPSDSCTWVVYPPGCAGDLLSSIVNFHFIETGATFKGINKKGQVIFRPSDMKHSNRRMQKNTLTFDDQFFYDIADSLSQQNLNWSKMDHFIFSNHYYTDACINLILSKFSNCKIIRLLPKTSGEQAIVNWLHEFKNLDCDRPAVEFPTDANQLISHSVFSDPRIVTVFFRDLISPTKFSSVYQQIQQLHSFPGPMITYDFIQFWIDQQHPEIQEYINRLNKN